MNLTDAPIQLEQDRRAREDVVIRAALAILHQRIRVPGEQLNSPQATRDYLRLRLAGLDHEVLCVLFLDAKNRVIACENMFRGTVTSMHVVPREVVRTALLHNACGVIVAHNHPSGEPDPSEADLLLTGKLKEALALVGVSLLDHLVVTTGKPAHSFAEHGQL